ncbi:DMT family transporter [Magnetovibrio sp.]|uniref:DMT family transporter n=1 Tax=Magnetovibrio sp. TaxID=2024836 RepID=UPI002F932168
MTNARWNAILTTVLAPCLWGTTYVVFTQTLPVEHPLLVAALRALPAGILLMIIGPGLPPRDKLVPLIALGLANIGVFFALLFVSATRLPGGAAATLMSAQPLLVGLLAWPLLLRRPHPGQLGAAAMGMVGVGLLIFDPTSQTMDGIGVVAALGAAGSMAMGTVLIERWGRVGTPLALTAWQLALGGMVLLPIALAAEGVPPLPSGLNAIGLAYLILPGTALAYWLWLRGIAKIGADVTFLSLLSPLVATLLGALMLDEWFSSIQWLGAIVILTSAALGMALSHRNRRPATNR